MFELNLTQRLQGLALLSEARVHLASGQLRDTNFTLQLYIITFHGSYCSSKTCCRAYERVSITPLADYADRKTPILKQNVDDQNPAYKISYPSGMEQKIKSFFSPNLVKLLIFLFYIF